MMSENQKEPQYKLRWSEKLRDKVVESAKLNSRSINAEICTRLEEGFEVNSSVKIMRHCEFTIGALTYQLMQFESDLASIKNNQEKYALEVKIILIKELLDTFNGIAHHHKETPFKID